jgi:AraC-like DNA-binding protein
MIEIHSFTHYSHITQPRRLKKHLLVWCAAGSTTLLVDHTEYVLQPYRVLTITSGQIHCFKNLHQAQGVILEFTLDFFCKDDTDIELIFHNGLFCHFAMNEIIEIPDYQEIQTQLNLISQELDLKPYQYLISIHARIELILIEINRAKVNRGDQIWKPDALFLKFLEMVRENFKHNYSLAELAHQLGTTQAKLNEMAKLHTGKTAQHVIYGLIISEAQRLLTYQSLSVKEVAYQLGFNDPFYFSNFFKKYTHCSPKSYQSRYAL